MIAVIISAGMGISGLQIPVLPCDAVLSTFSWASPVPADACSLLLEAESYFSEGVEEIYLVGSSRGVGPSQLAASMSPDLFYGYAAISGAGGPAWGVEAFLRGIECPVLQMAAEDEPGPRVARMKALDICLGELGVESELRFYAGGHGFLAESGEGRRDLAWFLCQGQSD